MLRIDSRDHRDHERREAVACAILRQHGRRHIRFIALVKIGEAFAEPGARVAADHQQSPRREFAVIGYADRGSEQPLQLFGIGTGRAELARGQGTPGIEKIERIHVGAVVVFC